MKDRTEVRSDLLGAIEVAADVDRSRCALCGEPNECVMASPAHETGEEAAPCWCVDRRFPVELTSAAAARDGGAACICRACLDANERDA